MELSPIGDKVVIHIDEPETLSTGGIIIPDVVRDNKTIAANRGTIIAIGPSAELHYSADGVEKKEMQVGDRVIFARYAGSAVAMNKDGKRINVRLIYDRDVICLISGEEEFDVPNPRKSMVK